MRSLHCAKVKGRALLAWEHVPYTIEARVVFVSHVDFSGGGLPTQDPWEWRTRKQTGVQYVPEGLEEGDLLSFNAKTRRGKVEAHEKQTLWSVVTQVVEAHDCTLINVEDCADFLSACVLASSLQSRDVRKEAAEDVEEEIADLDF